MSSVEWASFENRLRSYLRGRVEQSSIDDLVGDILLKLVRHRDEIESAGNPLAYTMRVAANTVTDYYRRAAVERRALADLEQDTPQGDEPRVSSSSEAGAAIQGCVVPFIDRLPSKYREALLLTEIEGMTQAAAAQRLGLSISGMKSRVQRGRALVREALLKCCVIELDRRGGIADYDPRPGGCEDGCRN